MAWWQDLLAGVFNLSQNQQYAEQVEENRRLAERDFQQALGTLGGGINTALYGNTPGGPGTTFGAPGVAPLQGGFTINGQPVPGGVNTASIQTRTGGGEFTPVYPEATQGAGYEGVVPLTQRLGSISDAYWGGTAPQTRYHTATQPLYGGWSERTTTGLAQGEDALRRAEQRYEQAGLESEGITAGARDLYGRGMGYLSEIGEQQRADLQQQYQNLQSQAQQNLIAQGLGGTTIGANLGAGMQQAYQADLNRLNEQLANQQLGWDYDLTQNVLASQADARNFGAQMSGDVINTLTGQQQFGAGLTADQLAAQQGLAVGGLNYGDLGTQQYLGQALGLGMIPVDLATQQGQAIADLWGQRNYGQPYPPQNVPYSWS